jgi:hypothetical protein
MGAAAAAGFAAWLAVHALASAPVAPAAAGLAAGVATLLLPRLGWAAIGLVLCAGALSQHHAGAALVILIGMLGPVLLLPGRPAAWPLAAAAPALGLIGLAGAWPALAARAGTSVRRAALGAIGWAWLALGGAIAGRVLYLPHVPGTAPPGAWIGSLPQATQHVLRPLVVSGALAPALVWALAAVVAPWLVRGRSAPLDVLRVIVWAAVVVSAPGAAITAVHGSDPIGAPPGAAVGAVASAAVALAPLGVRMWREALHSGRSGARVP